MEFVEDPFSRFGLTKAASCFDKVQAKKTGAVWEKEGYTVIGILDTDHRWGVYIKDFVPPKQN